MLDGEGKEVSRRKLDPGPGPMMRMAAGRFSGSEDLVPGFAKPSKTPAEMAAVPPPANLAASRGRGRRGRGPPLHPNHWKTLQNILDADVLALSLHQRRG